MFFPISCLRGSVVQRCLDSTPVHWLGRCFVGLAIVTILLTGPAALAADESVSEPYENGPIQQTYSPLSQENFNGGVKSSALKDVAPKADGDESFFHTGRKTEPSSVDTDLKTEKNPTLKRYTDQQQD